MVFSWDLLKNLVLRDLRVRYKVSVLGFFWSLLRPLFTIAVLTAAFWYILRFDSGYQGVPYAVFILSGWLPWWFLGEVLGEGTGSLLSNANILKRVYVPRVIFPLSVLVAKLVNFLLALAVLLPLIYVFSPLRPTWQLLWLPAIVLAQSLLLFGIITPLCLVNVKYRDVGLILEVVVMAWFYLSPVVYPADYVLTNLGTRHPFFSWAYFLNPMTVLLYGYRGVLLASAPRPKALFSTAEWWQFGAITGLEIGVLLLAAWLVLRRMQGTIEDYL